MALTTIKTGGLADNSVTDAKVANAITVTGAQTGITQVGTLTAGTWQGTPITSAYLNAAQTAITSVGTLSSLTLGGDLLVPQYIKHVGDTNCHIEFGTDEIKLRTGDSSRLIARDANVEIYPTLVATSATFSGQVKIDTDQRYFTKWETTYGTDRDYWWRNDGGLLQLGEGAEGDGQVKYTFDTANKRLGIGITAPGDYNGSADDLVIGGSGAHGMTIVTGTSSTGYLFFADGTSGNSAYEGGFEYAHNGDTLGMYAAGAIKLSITTDKVMFSVDAKVDANNSRDLGTNGTRWKDLYLAGNANVGGNAIFGGNITMPAGNSFFLDGGGNSKIEEFAADAINIQGGGSNFVVDGRATGGSGNNRGVILGVGTTTPKSHVDFYGKGGIGINSSDVILTNHIYFDASGNPKKSADATGSAVVLTGGTVMLMYGSTGNTDATATWNEGMRLKDNGYIGIGVANAQERLHVYEDRNGLIARFANGHSTPYGISIQFTNADPNNTSRYFLGGSGGTGGNDRFKIYADGSYSDISDEREKENIKDTESQLANINKLEIKDYNRIGDESKGDHIGVIAQQIEPIYPHLVRTNDDKIKSKMVYKIGLIAPLIKAVQELSAKVKALESA